MLLASLVRWALCALVLAVTMGRLVGVISPVAAAFASVVCSICHGCPVRHGDEPGARSGDHHEGHDAASEARVCECEACQLVAAGIRQPGSSAHEPTHDMGAGAKTLVSAVGWPAWLAHGPPPAQVSWLISWPSPPRLRSVLPLAPPTPPPRISLV
jgi:hypothetical protein